MPKRIQRKRTKGWKMPEGVYYVGRSGQQWAGTMGPFANPFRVGGYFKIGKGAHAGGFMWLEAAPQVADASFTKIQTAEQAVEFFREFRRRYPYTEQELATIRGRDLACWCALDKPCHADVLLELANAPESLSPSERGGQS